VRVLLWGELFWPNLGGAELFAAALMRALRPRGYTFAVVASHDRAGLPDADVFEGIPVYRLPFREVLSRRRIDELPAIASRANQLCRRFAPDRILLNGIAPNAFFCVRTAAAVGTPLIARVNHELSAAPARGTLAQQVLRRADWVIGVSTATLDRARLLEPSIGPCSSVIYNGVQSPAELPDAPTSMAPNLLCLGRLVHAKGFDLAIGALPAILRVAPGTTLTIVGDGPERGALQTQAAAIGVADAVRFTGWVAPEEAAAVIRDATVVLIPSRSEGLPAVALEAAAMGRPMVAIPTGGVAEIVIDGETGFLVGAEGLADAVIALLGDASMAKRFGRAAWRRVRDVFDPKTCFDAYDALLRRVGPRAA
jgi:glycosyltransferase involved in cell wall biosynthesis